MSDMEGGRRHRQVAASDRRHAMLRGRPVALHGAINAAVSGVEGGGALSEIVVRTVTGGRGWWTFHTR